MLWSSTRTLFIPLAFAIGGAIALSACTAVEQQRFGSDVKAVTNKIARALSPAAHAAGEVADRAAQRMKTYLAEKETLRTFHDASVHGETALLALLRNAQSMAPSASASANDGSSRPTRSSNASKRAPARPPGEDEGSGESPASSESAASGESVATDADGSNQATSSAGDGQWRWPLDAGIVSSEFGSRWGRKHRGIDIAARIGEPVFASTDGEVFYAGSGLRGYGNVIILRHADKMTTLYAHNSELKVQVGTRVTRGTLIALVGSTGRSTGPHVHFEIRRGEAAVDPRTMLPATMLAHAQSSTLARY